MNVKKSRWALLAAGLMGATGISPLSAALPTMSQKEWLGYFVGVQNRTFQFGLTSEGKAAIRVMGKKGDPLSSNMTIPVEILVEETLPDGKTTERKIMPGTLESAQPATDKPKDVVIRGKVTGGASFEVFVSEERGGISLGGRMLDPGTLKNPVRFAIALKFPNVYASAKKGGGDKKEVKAFEDKTKRDRLQLVWTDKTRVKPSLSEKTDANSKEINGPGITAAQLELSPYDGRGFEITASENSSMRLSNKQAGPLHEGFSLTWTADPAKDPEGKARLSIDVK